MKLIATEANIGVGKSTLLPKLAAALQEVTGEEWVELQEPVNDPEFLRLLKNFTDSPEDPVKRIDFQLYITNRRAEMLANVADGNYLIERSLYSDLVFAQANMLNMRKPPEPYLAYYELIKEKLEDYPQVSAVLYLKCDPMVAYQRMLNRNRPEEAGTPFQYIRDLENFHIACLPQICDRYNTPLINVDWSNFGKPEDVANTIDCTINRVSAW